MHGRPGDVVAPDLNLARWNTQRILEPIGDVPPVKFEATWRDTNTIEHCWRTNGRAVA